MKKSISMLLVLSILLSVFMVVNTQGATSLEVLSYNGSISDRSYSINPRVKISNNGSENLDLSTLTVRYYYTIDSERTQKFSCDWSSVGNSNVLGKFVKMSSPVNNADYYLEIGFTKNAGSISPGKNVEVQTRVSKSNMSRYTQSNDYSFNSKSSNFSDWDKVVVLVNGLVVFGKGPDEEISSTPNQATPNSVPTPTPTPVNSSQSNGSSIKLEFDKDNAQVGDIINGVLKIQNIKEFSGYQVSLKYDPQVLQPVNPETGNAYSKKSIPLKGDILNNSDYGIYPSGEHDLEKGILNFGKSYTNLEVYSDSGKAEETGTLAIIGFRVLKAEITYVRFENIPSMPNGIDGTLLFDWKGSRISGKYSVVQPVAINSSLSIKPSDVPTPTDALTPTPIPTSTQTPTPTPTQTPTPTPEETLNPSDNYIALSFDKYNAEVDEIIKATLTIKNIENFAGYQVNIKYDPQGLQAVNPVTGVPYNDKANPVSGNILTSNEYGVYSAALHDTTNGVLNFGRSYTNIRAYSYSGISENSGDLAIIGFRVLKKQRTSVYFEDTKRMPAGITGTSLYNWNGYKVKSGYTVIQPRIINGGNNDTNPQITPTPTSTSTSTSTSTPTPTSVLNNPTPTNTPVSLVTIEGSCVYLEVDNNKPNVGDIVKVSVKVNEIKTISGYQINIKYDPDMLQPVNPQNGDPYKARTVPSGGNIIENYDFAPMALAEHNLEQGILNFGKSYTNYNDYRMGGVSEETGIIAVIGFKVLKNGSTQIKFEDTTRMPLGKQGTLLFDWFGYRVTSDYKIIQPGKIN